MAKREKSWQGLSVRFKKPNGKIVCLNYHPLPNGDISCSYFGHVVTKECCERCKYGESSKDVQGLNKKSCPELELIDRPCWCCPEAPHCAWCPDEDFEAFMNDEEDCENEEGVQGLKGKCKVCGHYGQLFDGLCFADWCEKRRAKEADRV